MTIKGARETLGWSPLAHPIECTSMVTPTLDGGWAPLPLGRVLTLGMAKKKQQRNHVGWGKVIKWLRLRGISVVPWSEPAAEWCPRDNVIRINPRLGQEKRFHILLHEAGHVYAVESGADDLSRESMNPNSNAYKIVILGVEKAAWDLGEKIAAGCGVKIDKARYEQTKVEMLTSYLKWAARDKRFVANPHEKKKPAKKKAGNKK